MSDEKFIDDAYTPPSNGGGYSKIEQGDNKFRILSSPLMTWNIWSNGKCSRIPYNPDNKPSTPDGENAGVKHAWNMIVWNYQTEAIEIMELDKMTVIAPLLNHAKDEDWGHPKHYDIVITKSGSGKDGTKYALIAKPKKVVSDLIKEGYFATPIDLSEILKDGGNPFLSAPKSAVDIPLSSAPKAEAPKAEAPKAEEPKEEAPKNRPPF
jgi:hypothetical protein